MDRINELLVEMVHIISDSETNEKIELLNHIRRELHEVSPFWQEPIDLVQWVPCENVHANSYNPNAMSKVNMDLLHISISADHYTQPIVSMVSENKIDRETIDGYHRGRVGKEYPDINERVYGHLPVVTINSKSEDFGNRMSATVRHNRARGTHAVDKMSDIVLDLKKRNWSDEKIAKNLGMDADEVLRLGQISGLAEMFAHREFSEAWESEGEEVENELIIEE